MHMLKRCVAWVVRNGLSLLAHLLPLKKNRIMVFSLWKGFSGNLKSICDFLLAQYPDRVEIVWSFVNLHEQVNTPGMREVRYLSPAWFYFALSSKILLCDGSIKRFLPKRKGQFFIDTWHGGGAYKNVEGALLSGCSKAEQRSCFSNYNRIDLMLSSSKLFTQYTIQVAFRYRGAVLNCGMPRNDLFFDRERRERAARAIRERYGLRGYVVLYAPTFRGRKIDGYRTDFHFPYDVVISTLRERFGTNVTILKRAHPGGVMADAAREDVVDVTAEPEMQEILCAADLLITDYSSSIWDYALLGRPCVLYVPDLEVYERERGFFTPIREWPGIVCTDVAELSATLREFDAQACAERARRYLRESGSYETGTATRQVCDWILGRLDGGNA